MIELVLNDACPECAFTSDDEAIEVVNEICAGVADLVNHRLVAKVIRLATPIHEIRLSQGLTLHGVILRLLKDPLYADQGRLMAELTQKVPVEDDLPGSDFDSLVDCRLREYPGSLALLLCAMSGRLSLSMTSLAEWRVDPLHLVVEYQSSEARKEEARDIRNLFSLGNAVALRHELIASDLAGYSATDAWERRADLFPRILFAPSVQRNLEDLPDAIFKAALERLFQLSSDVDSWKGAPSYSCKVTGESAPTMQRFRRFRCFTGADGDEHVYELHARLADGYRLHFRELAHHGAIEVGYVGPHLKTVRFQS